MTERSETAAPNLPDPDADPTRWGWHRLLDNYRSSVDEIERLRLAFRVNALRWNPTVTHEEIERVISGQ